MTTPNKAPKANAASALYASSANCSFSLPSSVTTLNLLAHLSHKLGIPASRSVASHAFAGESFPITGL